MRILDKQGSKGNSVIFLPHRVISPSSSSVPKEHLCRKHSLGVETSPLLNSYHSNYAITGTDWCRFKVQLIHTHGWAARLDVCKWLLGLQYASINTIISTTEYQIYHGSANYRSILVISLFYHSKALTAFL